jgi:hypothetical protein
MSPRLPAFLSAGVLLLASGTLATAADQISIPVIDKMPEVPRPFVLRDWKKVARDFDAIAFDFERRGEFLPLPWWDDSRVDHDITGFALPAYVGDLRQTPEDNDYDAITCFGAVLGATKAGIDKSDQNGRNWVRMLNIFYSSGNGTSLYMNNPGAKTGRSFWYELLPSLLFFQIYDHYRDEPGWREQAEAIGERWYGGCKALGAGDGKVPDFDHTALDLLTGQPFDNPRWREPDAAAGVAWIEYMAHVITKEEKFLEAARWAMRFLEERAQNPYYECLLPYGAYLSARMNAEQRTAYPTEKLVNWVFDGSNPREWGVIAEKWGEVEAHGLTGSVHEGSEYAFTMNSYLAPAVMVPLVRYDSRYARAMARWVLNVAVNSRHFYADSTAPDRQTSWDWASANDPQFSIAYEGLRKQGATRTRPDGMPGVEVLRPGKDGRIDKIWALEVPSGNRNVLVMELKPRDGTTDRDIEVTISDRPDGPWRPAFDFASGDKSRKWRNLKKATGPLYVRLQTGGETAERTKPLAIESVFVDTRFDVSPFLSGDPLFHGWGRTDLGLYGASFVGLLGALVEPTNIEGILQIDCRATESWAAPSYPTFLLHNPHASEKKVEFSSAAVPSDFYDLVSKKILVRGAKDKASLVLAPDQAVVLVGIPAGGKLEKRDGRLECDGIIVDYAPAP